MTISAHTLIKAIRATAEKANTLERQIESAEDPDLSLLEDEWQSYLKALSELQKLYVDIQSQADNLPTYEELIS